MPRSRDEEMYELEGAIVKRNTLRAILIVTPDGEELWLPKSQINRTTRGERDVEPLEGDPPITIRMTAWIAKEKGLR